MVVKTIRKKCTRFLLLIMFALLAIQVSGCAQRKNRRIFESAQHKPVAKPVKPQAINVLVRIANWAIVQNQILNYDYKLGEVRFAGRYVYGNDLVFKFKSNSYSDCYWLTRIPSVEEGSYEIRGTPYFEHDSPHIEPLGEAPEKFSLFLEINEGRILRHYIRDYDPAWGKFKVLRLRLPLIYFRNPWYPGREWAAKLPREEGVWTIYATLIK